jgi:hypothetical protein
MEFVDAVLGGFFQQIIMTEFKHQTDLSRNRSQGLSGPFTVTTHGRSVRRDGACEQDQEHA